MFLHGIGGGVIGVKAPALEAAPGIVPHKAVDHRHKGDKEDHAQYAEKLSAQQSGGKSPQRRQAHRAAHHPGIDELVFNELYALVDQNAQNQLGGLTDQRQHSAHKAGGKCADIGNKGQNGREHCHNPRIGQAENTESDEHQQTQNHSLHALAGEKAGKGILNQRADLAEAVSVAAAQMGIDQHFALPLQIVLIQQHIGADNDGKDRRGHAGNGRCGHSDRRAQHGACAAEGTLEQLAEIQPGESLIHGAVDGVRVHIPAAQNGHPLRPFFLYGGADALHGIDDFRHRHQTHQGNHQHQTQIGEHQAQRVQRAAARLPLRFGKQPLQTAAYAVHGHTEHKGQHKPGQHGQQQPAQPAEKVLDDVEIGDGGEHGHAAGDQQQVLSGLFVHFFSCREPARALKDIG